MFSQTRGVPRHGTPLPWLIITRRDWRQASDAVRAEALGPGWILLTRQATLLDEISGALSTKGELRGAVDGLRDEWA